MHQYKLYLYTILFMFTIPLLGWYFNWELLELTQNNGWYTHLDGRFEHFSVFVLFLFTESVSFPYGIITAFFLTIIIARLLKLTLFQTCLLLVVTASAIIFGLGIKSLIKHITSEPRPYMLWLANLSTSVKLDLAQYYALTDKAAQQALLKSIIEQPFFEPWHIPSWLADHWIRDREYSFPSGHTFFASFFALLTAGLLKNKSNWLVGLLIFWAMVVMLSRLLLGMHRPIDLIGGVIIALIVSLAALWLMHKFIIARS
ncbi:phosphatase PAP2 family protein [Thorsellia anophelis]|uniref:undecaprenyl-diphosphate phosphatase n=1 Tax=Thorsellia anophelis DSM 18579 TaxID=1123402 RepID=A0A1H9YM51_9GAMM|nr:phosphatase PAP2 family protein [Thorsellia anophelis]SES70201.1 phosphatidylglycerophosphatase B [Thorsellia anophelis DSM 18579]